MIETLGQGDTLVTPKFSRLARSTLQILEILKTCTERGITVWCVKENWTNDGGLSSEVIMLAFSMVAQIEKTLISIRTKEALAARRAAGVRLGRPCGPGRSKLAPHRKKIEYLLRLGVRHSYLAERFNTTTVNLWKYLKTRGINIATDTQARVTIA